MGTISVTLPVAGTDITAGLHATNYTTVANVINGNLDNANVNASAAIVQSKIAFDAWAAYTPAWNNAGTANVLSNGTLTGRYVQVGKTVHARIALTWGSLTTSGSSWWQFTLPVTGANTDNSGWANALDSSLAQRYGLIARMETTGYVALYTLASPLGLIQAGTNPFTWATSDAVFINITYEAA